MGMGPAEIVGVILGALGAYCMLSAFVPQVYNTYKTKNTVGINKVMFLLHLSVGVLFFYGAVFLVASGISDGGSGTTKIVNGVIFSVLNLICALGCLYTVLLKNQNVEESQKMGITELEHYHQVCVPFVQEKMLSSKESTTDEVLEVEQVTDN